MKRWWVFFLPMERKHWRWWWYGWVPGFRPPFQHCYAACEVTDSVIMYIDPQNNGNNVTLMCGRPTDHIRFVQKRGGRVLFVERADWHEELDDPDLRYKRGWTITCASVIAYHMALDTRAQTPLALFRVLLDRYGAREVEHEQRRRREQKPAA